MQILSLAALVAVMSLMGIEPEPVLRPALLPLAVAYVAGSYLLAVVADRRGRRAIMRGLEKPAALLAWAGQGYLLGGFIALMLAGWGGWITTGLHLTRVPLVGPVLAYLPFVLALLAHWYGVYGLDQAMRMRHRAELVLQDQVNLPTWTRRQYIVFNLRHNLLFIVLPGALLVLATDLLQLVGDRLSPPLSAAIGLVLAGCVFLFAPAMLVRVWRTDSLPPGAARDRLTILCRALKLKFRDIRLWQTGSVITNAGVMGLVGPVRYVVLSDAMLEFMPPEAVEAVFMHEAGHVVHHHILTMMVFTIGLGGLLTAAGEAIGPLIHVSEQFLPYLEAAWVAVAAVAWLLIFGRLSRLLERQADVFGACNCLHAWYGQPMLTRERVALFNRSLLMVCRLNGMSATARNFRHGSIQSRVDYLTGLIDAGQDEQQVNRQVRRVKRLCWAVLLAAIAVTVLLEMA